jgi:surface polysaccharide O-acyltransferase-like enzyme
MVACLCVVLIHVSAGVVTIADESTADWWMANILQAVIFWPVPVFIMISGYFLLEPKDETASQFIKKRTTRILIPAIFWTCVYLLWGHMVRGFPSSLSQAFRCVLSGNVSDHLYFLFALFGLYLLTPPLRAMMKGTYSGSAPLTLGITLSVMWSLDYLINRHLGQWGGNAANLPITFLGFYLAGYGFRRVESRLKTPKMLLLFGGLLLIGIVSAILVKGIEASQTTAGISFFYANSYFGLPLTMVSLSIFPLLLKSETVARLGEKK